jgi:UDP-N-acetylglucosamine 2-epimerase
LTLEPGGYLFATIHRAENREPAAIRAWGALLNRVATPSRPVILAIHPGTRAALERSGVAVSPDVRLIEPQGYRTSLTLQLHAAAVLTDSGGVQREAAWLGVPCLVLRGTTEWVEAVAGSEGRMVVVGLDAERAVEALDRLVPQDRARDLAVARAAAFDLEPAGAAEAIVAALDAGR